mgnify:CR=1 FL=1
MTIEYRARASWTEHSERGNPLLLRLLIWLTLKTGRRVGRIALYPICGYFFFMAPGARHASKQYLARVFAKPPKIRDVFRHFHCFAATLLDRIYFLNGNTDAFDIRLFGQDAVRSALEEGRGAVLLGSHLGSFEILRAVGLQAGISDIHMVMYRGVAPKIAAAMDRLRTHPLSIIELDRPGAMLRVKEALERGAIVGLLGDRILTNDRGTQCEFFGSATAFPQGPLHLAAILGAPVILAFGLYRGGNRYDVHFERFDVAVGGPAAHPFTPDAIGRYAQRLEYYCRLAPFNWFNFYDYWQTDAATK